MFAYLAWFCAQLGNQLELKAQGIEAGSQSLALLL